MYAFNLNATRSMLISEVHYGSIIHVLKPLGQTLKCLMGVCGSDTGDMSISVVGSGKTNPGVRLASVVTVRSTRQHLDGAHTVPGDSYGQRHEGIAI